MYHVYIIRSITHPEKRYIGKTTNLKKRISDHNCGTTTHTKKHKPWELVTCVTFKNELKAIEFEKYLKSCSGRAFANKRLL